MRDPATPIHAMGVADLSSAIAAREISVRAVVEACLARIAALNDRLAVFVHLDAEGALAAADEADAVIAQSGPLSALHGIPVGVKDIFDVAGMPTTCGSRVMGRKIATRDADMVAKLRQAGAIILGKVATHEFANGLPSLDLLDPPARNPWNTDYHPGGSSSGSGAGVAAGFFPLGLGSDTGGSARHPATHCGIAGLKPTYGLLPCKGAYPLSYSLDTVGLLAHGVRDLAVAMGALVPVDDSVRTLKGLRIGVVSHFHGSDLGDDPADPAIVAAIDDAAARFTAAGAVVTQVSLAPLQEYFAVNRVILSADAWVIHQKALRETPELYGKSQRESLLVGAFLAAEDLVKAQIRRAELVAQMDAVFGEVDILLCASSMETSQRFDTPVPLAKAYARQARAPFNITGHPAMSVAAGLAPNGLPVAIQLAAPPREEGLLLQVAAAFEALRGPMPKPPLAA